MWPFLPHKNNVVTILCNPQQIVCSWIQRSDKHAPLELKGYTRIPLEHFELERGVLFNPTSIKKYVTQFLHAHGLAKAYITIATSGPTIKQQLVTLPHASPTLDDFNVPSRRTIQWQYQYLYPNDSKFVFYVCGIPQELILQYKLLAIAAHLNIITLTTERMALFNLYQYIHGAAFRHAQLAVDMLQHNNMIEELFTADTLARLLYILPEHAIDITNEMPFLLRSCGLFLGAHHSHEAD